MTDTYPILRLLLSALCIPVAWQLRSWYFAATAICLAIPQSLYSAPYWRETWLPLESIRLVLAIWLSASLIFQHGRIHPKERNLTILFGLCIGVALCAVGWLLRPENNFQIAMTVREYCYLALSIAVVSWWVRLRWIRSLWLPPIAGLWCLWLVVTAISSTAGKGGLMWALLPWSGGHAAWILVGCISSGLKCLVCVSLLISLYLSETKA